MQFIDTHTHIYLEEFISDQEIVVQRALDNGINLMLLPNIDIDSIAPMMELCSNFSGHFKPMMGLHPTSVKEDFENQLKLVEAELSHNQYIAIGEIGLDFYWDKTYYEQQLTTFRIQLNWAKQHNLPVAIHTRQAMNEMLVELQKSQNGSLKGVLHCFNGTLDEAQKAIDLGFYLGIGGVLTYKKSTLPEILKVVPLKKMVLETDAPFLPPVPYRGKRNESAYLIETAKKLAEVKEVDIEKIAEICTKNTKELFGIK